MARRILFSDTFIRPDSTDLGSVWDSGYTGLNNLQIVSNKIRGTTLGDGHYETVNSPSFPANQWAMLRVATLTDNANSKALTVHLRCTAPATWTCYSFEIADPTSLTFNSKISRIVAGVETVLIEENVVAWGAGDYLLGTVEGYVLTLWRLAAGGNPITGAFTQILTWTDVDAAKLTSGRSGMKIFVTNDLALAEVDYFAAGDFEGSVLWLPQGSTGVWGTPQVIASGMGN